MLGPTPNRLVVLFFGRNYFPPLYHSTRHFSSTIYIILFNQTPCPVIPCPYPVFDMTTSTSRRAAGIVLLLYGTFSLKVSPTTCYSPGGYIIVNLNYQPCYTNETGPCCGAGDECLSNGMCFNTGTNNLVSQPGCTDPTFNAPGCSVPLSIFRYICLTGGDFLCRGCAIVLTLASRPCWN